MMWLLMLASWFSMGTTLKNESPFHKIVNLDCDFEPKNGSILSAVQPLNTSKRVVALIKGTGVVLENCVEKIVANKNDSENCEALCGEHGKCSLREKGTPIEHYECLCNYGYRGMHCEELVSTKFALMYPIWLCVVIEIVLVVVAIKRFANRKYFESPLPAQRFVDIMCARSIEPNRKKR